MPRNVLNFKPQGFRLDDIIATGKSSLYAYEIKNLRYNTIWDSTTMAWTTERGTKLLKTYIICGDVDDGSEGNKFSIRDSIGDITKSDDRIETVDGLKYYTFNILDRLGFQPCGLAEINNYWVLFGVINKRSAILRFNFLEGHLNEDYVICKVLYISSGADELGFSTEYPIDTHVFYENDNIMKVYWIDDIHLPRVINIMDENILLDVDSLFNFSRYIYDGSNTTVEIEKITNGGVFSYGTVQYALTYYKKFGLETNPFYISDFWYPMNGNNGLKADGTDSSADSFKITIKNPNKTFDYVRLYCIEIAEEGSDPTRIRIVEDKAIEGEITIIDTGNKGSDVIDSAYALLLNKKYEIIAKTFDLKSNTLFFGNITTKNHKVSDDIKSKLKLCQINFDKDTEIRYKEDGQEDGQDGYYFHNQLNSNSNNVKIFRSKEYYRFGVLLQLPNGLWSEVCYIGDFLNTTVPVFCESYYKAKHPSLTLQEDLINKIYSEGYIAIRPVCVFPTDNDRTRIFLGIINPTMANGLWRKNGSGNIHNISSWFFRPILNNNELTIDPGWDASLKYNGRHNLRWKHGLALRSSSYFLGEELSRHASKFQSVVAEILNVIDGDTTATADPSVDSPIDFDRTENCITYLSDNSWIIDWKRVTFNSPDLEYNDLWWVKDFNNDDFEVKVIGSVYLNGYESQSDASISPGGLTPMGQYFAYKLNKCEDIKRNVKTDSKNNYDTIDIMPLTWTDGDVYSLEKDGLSNDGHNKSMTVDYPLYPFHDKRANNFYAQTQLKSRANGVSEEIPEGSVTWTIKDSGLISYKVVANRRFDYYVDYDGSDSNVDFNCCKLWKGDANIPLNVNGKIYYGGFDNQVCPNNKKLFYNKRPSFDSGLSLDELGVFYKGALNLYTYMMSKGTTESECLDMGLHSASMVSSGSVPLLYNSTPHLVFDLEYDNIKRFLNNNSLFPKLLLVDVCRKYDSSSARTLSMFGGQTEEALANDLWRVSNQEIYRIKNHLPGLTIEWKEGDHYLMRYDCLKTYPHSVEDLNLIVEIASFMVETRIPLDAKYDNFRSHCDLTSATNVTYGKVNKFYHLNLNYFRGIYLNLNITEAVTETHPNEFLYTQPKSSSDIVDKWTIIDMNSIYDADGDLGEITKIKNLNEKLILFQTNGIAVIDWNEKALLENKSGLPLSVVNSMQLNGVSYISNLVGCLNKWSVVNSDSGLMWIDDNRYKIYSFGENGVVPISTKLGIDKMFILSLQKNYKTWAPSLFDSTTSKSNYVVYFDKTVKDVLFINNELSFAFNDNTATFTSFYDYNAVPYMQVLRDRSLCYKDYNIWALREGDEYSNFFNNLKPYWITICCDGAIELQDLSSIDKVFDYIEYTADVFNADEIHRDTSTNPFNIISSFNANQKYEEFNTTSYSRGNPFGSTFGSNNYPWRTTRKFNVWRDIIPRHHDTSLKYGELTTYNGDRDRTRNYYTFIKLKKDFSGLNGKLLGRMILHNLRVDYSIK